MKLHETLQFIFMYNSGSFYNKYLMLMGKKWEYFVNLSTITHMKSNFGIICGKSTTKSITILSYFHLVTSKDCNILVLLWYSILPFRQTKHYGTYYVTSFFILNHQNAFFRSWYIFVVSRYMHTLLLGASSKIIHTYSNIKSQNPFLIYVKLFFMLLSYQYLLFLNEFIIYLSLRFYFVSHW